MDRTSFYGGPSGESFQIRQIFQTRTEMENDLKQRWSSSIGVGDFVVISYGLPGKDEDTFLERQESDNLKYGQSYNSTLWQKIYTENDSDEIDALSGIEVYYAYGNYGLGYKLIASMSGNTARASIYTRVIHSYETPYWKFYDYYDSDYPETVNAGLDRPVIIAFLPMAQTVEFKRIDTLNAEDKPIFIWDTTTYSYTYPAKATISWSTSSKAWVISRTNCGSKKSSYDSDHNAIEDGNDKPMLWLGIPPGWQWEFNFEKTDSDQDPTAVMTDDGNTQTLSITLPYTWQWVLNASVLEAISNPSVTLQSNAQSHIKTLNIGIPKPWSWSLTTNKVNANVNPSASLTNDGASTQQLTLNLPKPWAWALKSSLTAANTDPTLSLSNNGVTQTLTITLPKAWTWALSGDNGTCTILDADQMPSVVLSSDGTNNYFEFQLPQSQVMADPKTNVTAPATDPVVSLNDDDINSPYLIFDLPRGIRFYYGNLLGKRSDGTYTLSTSTVADYQAGDYYINQDTGFIYEVTANNSGKVTFKYVACIQSPLPEIATTSIDPYTANGASKVDPYVTETYNDLNELTGWKLTFNLPHLPDFSVTHDFVGAGETGNVTITPTAEDNVNFHLTLPQGSRMFAGTEVSGAEGADVLSATVTDDPVVGKPLPGDLYLNTETGYVYKLSTSGVWLYQNKGLKGPVGDALNIVADYTLTVDETNNYLDNLGNGVAYIKAHYTEEITSEKIFAITWQDATAGTDISYWYFCTDPENDTWGRVQLTGSLYSFIYNEYTDGSNGEDITNKTYSVEYINSLIGNNLFDHTDRTAFSKDQIYALLAWGTFAEANDEQWWPEEGTTTDTLSIDEVIELMSWGHIATLAI